MFTFCRGWICGAFAIGRLSFLPSMIVVVREIHSCTVHCLKHDILQNSLGSISAHLAVFHWTICSNFADYLLHGNGKCILSSTVNWWNSWKARDTCTPTCVANIWLLSFIVVVADKLTHCPNTISCVLLWLQYSFTRTSIYFLHLPPLPSSLVQAVTLLAAGSESPDFTTCRVILLCCFRRTVARWTDC